MHAQYVPSEPDVPEAPTVTARGSPGHWHVGAEQWGAALLTRTLRAAAAAFGPTSRALHRLAGNAIPAD